MTNFKIALKFTLPGGNEKEIDLTEELKGLAGDALDLLVKIEGGKLASTIEVTEA